ncbi:MAG: energy-coupling factor ABC transporter permease [Brevinematia bacterium]
MHIPEYLLKGSVCPVSAAMGIAGVIATTYFVFKSKEKIDILKFGIITSFVFLLQMLNFPISGGTSGHFLGVAFLIFLLGIPYGILSMSIILAIQAIVFADGGLTTLGANIFNMAIAGAIPVILLYNYKSNKFIIFLSSVLSILFASLSCSVFLSISYPENTLRIFSSMMGIHSLISIFEGIITIVALLSFSFIFENISSTPAKYLSVAGLFIVFLLLTPFASNLPDGLEWVAEKYNLLKENEPLFVALIPDYSFKGIQNEILSTILAGTAGILITLLISSVMMLILKAKQVKKSIQGA